VRTVFREAPGGRGDKCWEVEGKPQWTRRPTGRGVARPPRSLGLAVTHEALPVQCLLSVLSG
jgi:hypothetical protein